ncbi:hypothetical protein HDE_03669 [Halotydeus destructor]|nr:hypothetical protein HDE_03669 [Halotydeus destructor]
MSRELRVAYSRAYGYLNQDFEYIPQEINANITIVNDSLPILGSYSAYINYMAQLVSKRNMTLRLVRPEVPSVGAIDKNGVYDGIIGLVQQGSADVSGMPIGTSIGNVVDFTNIFIHQPGYLVQDVTLAANERPSNIDFLHQALSVYTLQTMVVIFLVFSAALLAIQTLGNYAQDISKSRMSRVTMFELFRMFMNQHDTMLANYKQRSVYMGSAFGMMIIMWVVVNSIGTKQVMPGQRLISTLEELYNEDAQHTTVQWSPDGYTAAKFLDIRHALLHKIYVKFKLKKTGIRILDFATYKHQRGTFIVEELSVLAILERLVCGMTVDEDTGHVDEHLLHRILELDETFAHAVRKNLSQDLRDIVFSVTSKIAEHGFSDEMYELGVLWNDLFKISWSYCGLIDPLDAYSGLRPISYQDFIVLSRTVFVTLVVAIVSLALEGHKHRSLKRLIRRQRRQTRRLTKPVVPASQEYAPGLHFTQNIQFVQVNAH